jgi:hypothetical protein
MNLAYSVRRIQGRIGARGSAHGSSHPRMSLEEEDRFATVLGG